MAGFDASMAEQRQRPVQQYALEQMMLANQGKQLENQRYGQLTPHEVDARRLGNREIDARIPGVQADSDLRRSQARVQQGTEQGQIGAVNQTNQVSQLENALRSIELQAGVSPMYADAEYQRLRQGAPKQIQDMLPIHYEPGLADRARNLVMNNPAHRRTQAIENTKGQYGLEEQELRNKGSLAVANVQSQRAQAIAQLRASQEKVEAKLAKIIDKILDGTATDMDRKMYTDLQTIMMQLRAAGQANVVDPNAYRGPLLGLPSDPRGVPNPVPAPGTQQPVFPPGSPQNPIPLK